VKRWGRLALVAAGVLGALPACHRGTPVTAAARAVAVGGSSHALPAHAAIGCVTCHADKPPGHEACAGCHAATFAAGALAAKSRGEAPCAACHEPPLERALPARFSHRVHMDRAKFEETVGFHVVCEDCHGAPQSAEDPRREDATHEICARCHETRAPRMADCAGCHALGPPISSGRRFIRADLRFSHGSHERDRVGRAIGCNACHDGVTTARTVHDIEPPQIQRCTLCHEDRRITSAEVKMGACKICHLVAMTDVLAPRTHQLGTVAPDDHTLAFRGDHADAARSAGARCAQCHQGLSGSSRDSCQECHAVMRPRDHTLTWREEEHGREAGIVRERCVACHAADYCEACHSVPPRSHLPRSEWTLGHAQVARLGLRACFACHTFDGSRGPGCMGSGCHQRGLR
jgi:hypothetical protein